MGKFNFRIILPVLVVVSFAVLVVDAVKGPGSFAKHFFIDGRLLWALTLIWYLLSARSKITELVSKISLIIFIPLFLSYFSFVIIESAHFQNYVLSVYKIHLDGLIYLPLFTLSLFLAGKVKDELTISFSRKFKSLVFLLLIILATCFTVWNLGEVINTSFNSVFYDFLHPTASYDQKMFYQWGDFYRFMVFVKNNSPENAKVVIPPELEPWLARTGDVQFVRAFLWPRKIVQYSAVNIPDLNSLGKGTFILVSWGERDCPAKDCHGWPKQKIFAARIFYKDPDSASTIETKTNFVYEKDDYKYVYGLIELK